MLELAFSAEQDLSMPSPKTRSFRVSLRTGSSEAAVPDSVPWESRRLRLWGSLFSGNGDTKKEDCSCERLKAF